MAAKDLIFVLDFGGQYAHLIANRVRRLGVYSEIKDPLTPLAELRKAKGIILSGGPGSVYDSQGTPYNPELFKTRKPVLGICYGHQVMGHELGGKVVPGTVKEYGKAALMVKKKEGLFAGLSDHETVWMSHGDTVARLPPGFEIIGSTPDCPHAAIADFKRRMFGVQFHVEVTHTPQGGRMLKNFLFKVCKCKKSWNVKGFAAQKVKELRREVGKKNVFLLISGGVDSVVSLALLNKAIGSKRIYALHVDHGFMRKEESLAVERALKKLKMSPLHVVDAGKEFYEALRGVVEPEQKRKVIGGLFVKLANQELRRLNLKPEDWLLGQGTIYPDTIESAGTRHACRIKTHHNRIDSLKEMMEAGLLVEPIKELYKDEVRELGVQLGLPGAIVKRHPFPGPGLAIRALCSNGQTEPVPEGLGERVNALASKFGLKAQVLPLRSVGVQGDERTYRLAVALQGQASWTALEECSTRLTNEVKEVNRVVWLLEPKAIESVRVRPGYLTRSRLDSLREADDVVNQAMAKTRWYDRIWQFPVVLVPLAVNAGEGESIVLRPVFSTEAMTAKFAPLPPALVEKMVKGIRKLKGITAVFYDVTHKPPATICWE
ncbi:MAG: glutamine-hydrolyzing GMP synthase [Candidatus Diapherotrites archaeon]|uniref:GMP synthase (glutamine-hydrolyzing) n=1 Tax=Candidatus Iainarchaeum sp. TaxID=3101447 RepID=A0A8T4L9V4_9ARCH|nr:glutamine-hydrolyzing GMP synthase [Candidatus Diapherotrites archaeon]